VDGLAWQDTPTEQIASSRGFFAFAPGARWHGFDGYAEDQYFVDPNKLLLTTPGLDPDTGEYEEFGIPATILESFLRESGIIAEKCALNSILFLLTPAETLSKMQHLVARLMHFEELIERDAPLAHALPSLHKAHRKRYEGYTIRRLAQEMHDFFKRRDVKRLQKMIFREEHFPRVACTPQLANESFTRGDADCVPLREIEGRVAAEGALPYLPGVVCVVPGEIWGPEQRDYFLVLEDAANTLPGFAPELQGIHLIEDGGEIRADGYVLSR
jgi:ornithine decarboxylase